MWEKILSRRAMYSGNIPERSLEYFRYQDGESKAPCCLTNIMARAKDWIKFNLSVPCKWKYPNSANTFKKKSLSGNIFFCSFSGKNSFACIYSNGESMMGGENRLRWSPLIWLQKGEAKRAKIFERMKCYCGFLWAPTAKLHIDFD